jgi:2-dehydropantoate 2-reductase
MKITVLGAGAVGSMLGGLLKRHAPDLDVLLIARGEHGEQMRRQGGVHLQGCRGSARVALPVSSAPEDLAGSDVVLLTVKSHSTDEAMRQAAEHIGPATVVSIQNGINQRTLLHHLPARRLVMAVTDTIVAITRPGAVSMQRAGTMVVGPSSSGTPMDTVRGAAALLGRSRQKAVIDPNVLGAQYNKLVFNVLGAAASLSASDLLGQAVLFRPWRNVVAIPLQQECLTVMAESGIELSRLGGGSDVWRFRRLLHLLNRPVLGPLAQMVVRRFFRRRPIRFSLGADLARGKKTEVDAINGEILRLARAGGIGAPLNGKVVQLVHQLEQRGGFFTREEVVAALGGLPESPKRPDPMMADSRQP